MIIIGIYPYTLVQRIIL